MHRTEHLPLPLSVRDATIEPGTTLVASVGSANRDEAHFGRPRAPSTSRVPTRATICRSAPARATASGLRSPGWRLRSSSPPCSLPTASSSSQATCRETAGSRCAGCRGWTSVLGNRPRVGVRPRGNAEPARPAAALSTRGRRAFRQPAGGPAATSAGRMLRSAACRTVWRRATLRSGHGYASPSRWSPRPRSSQGARRRAP